MAIMALGLIAGQGGITRRPVLAALMIAAALGLTVRSVWAMGSLPVWSASIYSQQYQMARFLSEYYQGASVAANDIGAINYFADLRCLDLVGLANIDVMRAKRRGTYSTDFIAYEAAKQRTEIALVYDSWFAPKPKSEFGGPPLPANWVRVARWSVPDFGILGSDTVSFYAVRPDARDKLRQNLQAFAPKLPRLVTADRPVHSPIR